MTRVVGLEAGFGRAAPRYDLLVACNPGYHRHLRTAARALLRQTPEAAAAASLRLLDLGCGSGASTRALLRAARGRLVEVTGVDASAGMLEQAGSHRWPTGVGFVRARAEQLDDLCPAGSHQGVVAAYLLRNVPESERDALCAAVLRVLRPGGVFFVQEYSVTGNRRATVVWTAVCRLVVVPLAILVRGHPDLYRYLWRSVLDFESPDRLAGRLREAGCVDVTHESVGGWQRGILHTFTARRYR